MIPLTPEQIAENERIKVLPVITNLSENQIKIMDSIEKLDENIEEEKIQNNARFDEGSANFKELFDGLSNVNRKVDEMNIQMSLGFNNIVEAIHKKELSELKAIVQDKRDAEKDDKKNKSQIKVGVIIAISTIILTTVFSNIENFSFVKKADAQTLQGR